MRARIYVCHTFYHVYVACLKELNIPKEERGKADMVLSTMSCEFGNLSGRLVASGLFGKVFIFEEQEESRVPGLAKYHKDRGNIVLNMLARMVFCKSWERRRRHTSLWISGSTGIFTCSATPTPSVIT